MNTKPVNSEQDLRHAHWLRERDRQIAGVWHCGRELRVTVFQPVEGVRRWEVHAPGDDCALHAGRALDLLSTYKQIFMVLEGREGWASCWRDALEQLQHCPSSLSSGAWLDRFDAIDPFISSQADVQFLIDTAPTPLARGLVIGVDMFRRQLEAVTGRPYANA
jgi:hypothetical protein